MTRRSYAQTLRRLARTVGAGTPLAELTTGRTQGPLFLTYRRPGPAATADRCPHTGLQRLSYERAEYVFKQASAGHTLHQLRRGRADQSQPTTASLIDE